jgi:serine/threonine kinase 32
VGYGTSPDWFSLGVTFYECIYGRLPFDSDKGDSLSRQIQYMDVQYPQTSPLVTPLCVMAMSNLLDRDHHTRIGASSWSSFTDHPFFQDLDFQLLENKRIPPIFRPSQEKSNFDAVYELEELLLEQAPLEGRARKAAKKHHPHAQQQRGQSPAKDGADALRSKKDPLRKRTRGNMSDEDREEEILEMLNQFFEPYDYTRYNLIPS